MKAFFNYIFWIIGLYAFASGCDYPTQMDEVVKTNPALLPNEEESIILQLSDNETFLIDQFNNDKHYATTRFTSSRLPLSNFDFARLYQEFPGMPQILSSNMFAVVLFFDRKNDFDPVDITNIKGVAYYFTKDKMANMAFLSKGDNGEFKLNLESGVEGLYSQTLTYLLHHELEHEGAPGYLAIYNYEFDYDQVYWQFEEIALRVVKERAKLYSGFIENRYEPCDCPQPDETPNCNIVSQICEYFHLDEDDGLCPVSQYPSELKGHFSGMNNDSINYAFDQEFYYDFRDEFLVNSELGLILKSTYYELDSFMDSESISPSIALKVKTFRLLYKMKVPIQNLMTGTNGSYVFLTSTNATAFLDLLDEYRALSTYDPWEAKIDLIKSEVNTFSGQTITYILNNI